MKGLMIFLPMLLLCTVCTKSKPDEPINPPPPIDTLSHIIELGKVSVLKNGAPWEASFHAKYYQNDKSMFLLDGSLLQNNSLKENFGFRDIPSKKGIHLIERGFYWNLNNYIPQALFTVTLDIDQYLNGYEVDTTRTNQYVEILRYDSVSHVVEGRFQTFLEGPNTWSFLPDSMAMTEGKFHLKIQE